MDLSNFSNRARKTFTTKDYLKAESSSLSSGDIFCILFVVGDCLWMVGFRASIMTIDVKARSLLPTTGQVQIFAGDDCDSMALSNW